MRAARKPELLRWRSLVSHALRTRLMVLAGIAIACALPQMAAAQSSPSEKPSNSAVEPGGGSTAGKNMASKPTPEAIASTAPKVTYKDGSLTIIAENVPLSAIMSALHAAMGTDVDLPAGASDQPIWVHVGPGPAWKVLDELLSGTDFNFVIQGSPTDEAGIRTVLLTEREKPETGRPRTFAQPREQMAEKEPPEQPEKGASGDIATPENPASPAVAATPEAPSPGINEPRESQSTDAEMHSAVADPVAHPAPPPSMSQDEISQQLLSMYQQRRQLQQLQQPQQANPPTR